MDKSGPVYTKAKITVKYIMGCAIGMQLHSHGLVKAYVTDCARVIQLHSHGLVKAYVTDCARVIQLHSHGLVKNLRHGLHNRDVTTFPRSSETCQNQKNQ